MYVLKEEWDIDLPPEVIEEDLKTYLGDKSEVEDYKSIWKYTKNWGLHNCKVELDPDKGKITYTKEVKPLIGYILCISLIILSILSLLEYNIIFPDFSGILLNILFLLSFSFYITSFLLFDWGSPEWHDIDISNSQLSYGYPYLVFLFGVSVLGWIIARNKTVTMAVDFLMSFWILLALVLFYSVGDYSISKNKSTFNWFTIPGIALLYPLVTFIVYFLTNFMGENTPTYSRIYVLILVLVTIYLVSKLFKITYLQCKEYERGKELKSPSSLPLRLIILAAYTAVNGVVIFLVYVMFEVILFGIIGRTLYGASEETKRILSEGYPQMDIIFEVLPILPPRVYNIGFQLVLISPVLVIFISWIYHITSNWISDLSLLLKEKPERKASDLKNAKIVVLEGVNPHSKVILFGLFKYIVLNKETVEKLSEKEINSVIYHEYYHLKNRDWIVNALASIFSVLLGGRNALLVFYNYPKKEKEADDYAAKKIGADHVINAIRKLRKPRKSSKGWKAYLSSPYRLFFGNILFQASHLDPDKRIQRLREKWK